MNLRIYKIRKSAKLPVRAHATDAGIDLFYCPDKEHALYGMDYCIPSSESKIVPTGIKVEVPYGYMLEIKNKSSVAAKKQLLVGACVVDSGYDGEVFVNLHNVGAATRVLEAGQKIAQAVLIPIEPCVVTECKTDTLNENSTRGIGALGSTGDR
jgi:dUTP pyrophosphatase|tara:strand:+ start:636 stop:1097 length:462 start_codon:yes stop_codon:yes gene_type:complete